MSLKRIVVTLAAGLIASAILATSVMANIEYCEASWYGPGLNGNPMANGKRFNMNDDTIVAHNNLPFGTQIRVTNLNNNRSVVVMVQDRGPHINGRCVDLSRAAAERIRMVTGPSSGTAPVRVEVLRPVQ